MLGAKANMAVSFVRAGFDPKLLQADVGERMCFAVVKVTGNVSELLYCLRLDWKSTWRSLWNPELLRVMMEK